MRSSSFILTFALAACASPTEEPTEPLDPLFRATDVEAVHLEPGEEIGRLCFSWTLDNDEPLYVSSVHVTADPGVHHSNWVHVPESQFRGPDGVFDCEERGFYQEAAALDGGVLYAQSTQATDETQQLLPGAAIPLRARSRVLAEIHYLNASASPVDVGMHVELHGIAADEVTTRLSPMVLVYYPLEIGPRGMSTFSADCAIDEIHQRAMGRPLDFSLHYVLPHYHGMGRRIAVEKIGGPDDGAVIAESTSTIGEPLAVALDPPVSMAGATGLRFACTYENLGDDTVEWGIGQNEMCVVLGFTDSPNSWLGTVADGNEVLGEVDGVTMNAAPCEVFTIVSAHTRMGF